MKIATWNVNSLRAREDLVLDWVERNQPDILCLQETKVTDQEFPEDAFGDLHYDVVYTGQASYNGVAIAAKEEITAVEKGLPGDGPGADKRFIAATIAGLRVASVYVPNGQSLTSDKYPFKLEWLARLAGWLESSASRTAPLIVGGDYNIAPLDGDVWNPEERVNGLFVSEPERAAFAQLLEWGLTDALIHFDPAPKQYTWWDYRAGSWERNHGMRIDHLLITQPVLARAKGVTIDRKARGLEGPSDHVPVILELEDLG